MMVLWKGRVERMSVPEGVGESHYRFMGEELADWGTFQQRDEGSEEVSLANAWGHLLQTEKGKDRGYEGETCLMCLKHIQDDSLSGAKW